MLPIWYICVYYTHTYEYTLTKISEYFTDIQYYCYWEVIDTCTWTRKCIKFVLLWQISDWLRLSEHDYS